MLFQHEKWKQEWIIGCRIAALNLAHSKKPSRQHDDENKHMLQSLVHQQEAKSKQE